MTDLFCLNVTVVLVCKNRNKNPYQLFFPTFEAYKSVKFDFQLATILSKTGARA